MFITSNSRKAKALTVLSPIKPGSCGEAAYSDEVRYRLQCLGVDENSPMSKVPQTYLCRFFVLDDVIHESLPGADFGSTVADTLALFSDRFRRASLPREDHLQSKYLVFCCNLYGDIDAWARGMWQAIPDQVRHIWEFCYGFDQVKDADSFAAYIRKCRLSPSLYFVGSTDDPLEEQLKALYVKQEFARFAAEHQGWPADRLQAAYREFIRRIEPANLAGPSWRPGQAK